jgi:hypothetical protein
MVFPVVENGVPAIDVPSSTAKTPALAVKHMISRNVFVMIPFMSLSLLL